MRTMTSPRIRNGHHPSRTSLTTALAMSIAVAALIPWQASAQEEDLSVEALYRSAANLAIEGNFTEAIAKYEKLFDLAGEFLCEDFGPQAGGIVFDYGAALLQVQEWEKARDAFERCHFFDEKDCAKSKVKNENTRKDLALFQWGFCESQLGNHARALELYDQYLETVKTKTEELAKIRNAFKLRRGASLVKVGRLDEGAAEIKELFDKRIEWQVTPQFLMQGLLELGMGWVEQAQKATTPGAAEQIEVQAQLFLDQNAAVVDVSPVDKFRFGFIDRLKKLGFDSSEAGMQTLALRFFSMVPTLEEVEYDLQSRIQILPGQAVPAAYQQIIDQVKAQREKPISPDLEMQRLTARAYELLGNYLAPREIYRHLVEFHPDVEKDRRAELLHEAARFSTMIGDYASAQYFGEIFLAEMPDHKLRDNVSVFMLQSLFSSQQFDEVVRICEMVRERFQLGDEQRELPDALYGLALYSLGRYEDAQVAFDEYAKTYKGTPNREMVMYHRANNRMILGDFRQGAELAHEFQQEFPESTKFGDLSLSDLALCRYNLEDYTAAIAAVEKLEEGFPQSEALDRAYNIKGDSLVVRSDDVEDEAESAKLREEGLQSYLKA
ncbi:MAG: tetratricopeptide repeat protein, partial [Verrucomicrobiae bacterium]|nr:tetratricopeptide repeat protein [Verrucomicrobiae bacterium]